MYKQKKIGLIIPAFNEAENIQGVLKRIPDYIDKLVVVNDGSVDNTAELAKKNGAEVVNHKKNRGVGATFNTGVKYLLTSDIDIMVNMDADGQFNPDDISKLLDPIVDNKADFVTASRFKDKDLVPVMSPLKLWGNRQMARFIGWLTGEKFYDVSCGFRAYSAETLNRMNLFGTFTYTQETFIDLVFKDMTIMEVPVKVLGKRSIGKSRVASNLFRYAYQTLKIILRTFRDYKPFKLFGFASLLLALAGFVFLFVLFYFKFTTGSFTPYKWSGFAAGVLFLSSLIFLLLGFILDMFARMRHNQEEILFHLKNQNGRH
jgi:glycosyltransferase involved in cell wall biosynthesis